MCAILSIIMLIGGFATWDSLLFVASGLFAIGAEINYKQYKEEKE